MIDIVKAYWQLAIGLLLCLSIACGVYSTYQYGYKKGKAEIQALWDADTAKRDKAAADQSAKARDIEAKQIAITNVIRTKYEQTKVDRDVALSALRDYKLCAVETVSRGGSLQVAKDGSHPVSGKAKGSGGIDDTDALAASFIFANAVKDRDKCMAIQEWVKAQGM